MKKTVLLIILDGWGYSKNTKGNAIANVKDKFIDNLFKNYPHSLLSASGNDVGLPNGIMGNSEVGHMNIGAGRIILQDLSRIDKCILDGNLAKNKTLISALIKVKRTRKKLHFVGLLSDGGVHSQITHLKALLDVADNKGVSKIVVHPVMDGRDTPPESGIKYLKDLESFIKKRKAIQIGSISGRFYAMDRDTRWQRIAKAYRVLTEGRPLQKSSPQQYLQESYQKGITDEFIKPVSFSNEARIEDGDTIVFFNFRSDRARELTRAFTEKGFNNFSRKEVPKLGKFICMTEYDPCFGLPVLFPKEFPTNTLGEIVAKNNLKQFRIAETEKYAHVTFFFNGGREIKFKGEDRVIIASNRNIETYDKAPEMSADKITRKLQSEIKKAKYDLIVVNYANCDMVGHTGDYAATMKGISTIYKNLEKLIPNFIETQGTVLITADHGNAEEMLDKNGNIVTSHSTNKVPLLLISKNLPAKIMLKNGCLADVSPTILDIMGIKQPSEMTGQSLLK